MSLAGSCFSSESAPGPSIMGVEDGVEQSFGRPCCQRDGRSKRPSELTSSIVPRGTSFHRRVELEFPPIGFDPVRLLCCYRGLFPFPAELGAVNPDAVHDHSQSPGQRYNRLFHPAAPGDLHRPGLEPGPFLGTHHGLSCFVEHRPHHLISTTRYSAVPIHLARLMLGARQPKHRPDGLGFAEASRNVDGGAIGQRHHGANAGGRHQALAHLVIADDANRPRCRMTICSRNTRRTMSIGSTRTAKSGRLSTSSLIRASNFTFPTMPTLRPKLRNVPRRSFSRAMALDSSNWR